MEVTYIDHMGTDLSVVNAARVSFGKKSDWDRTSKYYTDAEAGGYSVFLRIYESDSKLIKYLAKHNHHSPFNHTYITMHVKAPIFVARQLVKHKFMPWNEISRRYVDDEPEFYIPEVWRAKAEDRKQGSHSTLGIYNEDDEVLEHGPYFTVKDCMGLPLELYNTMIKNGVAPEQARMVLPQNIYTEWYWSGTLHAWASMYNLRSKEDTQYETRLIANQCGEILAPLFPVSWKELTNAS
jgi:thymidylate synthase (FAD)